MDQWTADWINSKLFFSMSHPELHISSGLLTTSKKKKKKKTTCTEWKFVGFAVVAASFFTFDNQQYFVFQKQLYLFYRKLMVKTFCSAFVLWLNFRRREGKSEKKPSVRHYFSCYSLYPCGYPWWCKTGRSDWYTGRLCCLSARPGQAGEMGSGEPNEVRQGQVQGPAHGEE